MKAFLLAAGHGTRLRPYTDGTPKCLLPVCGVPILEIWFALSRRFGISEILVNTHSHAAEVKEFVGKWRDGVRVTVVEEPALHGSAGTLLVNRGWVQGEDKFWVFYADVLTNVNLGTMLDSHAPGSAATLGLYSVSDPKRCGIATLAEDGRIVEFVEKPSRPKGNLAFAGLMLATPELLNAIPQKSGADIAFDVLPRLLGRIHGYRIADFVMDIGTIENYHLAQKTWPGIQDRVAVNP